MIAEEEVIKWPFKLFLVFISFAIIAWGQPGVSVVASLCASTFGYSFFFIAIADYRAKQRFLFGLLFFTLVQLVQLYWLISHPYLYIYGVWMALSLLMGAQFGLLCA